MLVIVMGLPGSGKSYFAEKLAVKLRAEHLKSDRIRKDLNLLGRYSLEDKVVIYSEMKRLSEENLKTGKPVVLDATFHLKKIRQIFYELADKFPDPIFLILVEAEEHVIRERLSKPREDSEADLEVYNLIKGKFEAVSMPHLKLQSTQNNITEMISIAEHYIQNPHESERS